jgi:hypothetical protein
MSMSWVRKSYGVPAKRGARVIYRGRGREEFGTICSAIDGYLKIRLDGVRLDGATRSRRYHPTWMLEYVSGGDSSHGDE